MYNTAYDSRMHWRPFILYHLAALLLVASWLFPPFQKHWDNIDEQVFYFLNSSLSGKPFVQIFWALANVKLTDLFGALFMTTFFLFYILDARGKERLERIAQFFFVLIWFEIGILFTKQVLNIVIHYMSFIRQSPTLVLDNPIMLSASVPWLKVKDIAQSSFPGDHAEIVLQWTAFIYFFCNWRYGTMASIGALFFILPRLIAGAHWFSDAAVGSTAVIFCVLAWATCTPLFGRTMSLLLKLIYKITGAETNNESLRDTLPAL
jgi:membrane-associated phospholipid phosphatase